MMFRCNFKITGSIFFILPFLFSSNVFAAQAYTQTLTIENGNTLFETVYENPIEENEMEDIPEKKRELIIYDSVLSNPYIYPVYTRETVYKFVPVQRRYHNPVNRAYYPHKSDLHELVPQSCIGSLCQKGGLINNSKNYNNHAFDYTGHTFNYSVGSGLYYGANGKKYYVTPPMPVTLKSTTNKNESSDL